MKTISVRGQRKNCLFTILKTSDLARRFVLPKKDQPGYERFHSVFLIFYYDITSDFVQCPAKLMIQYANEIIMLNHYENMQGYRTAYEAYVHSLPSVESMCVK